MTGFVPERRAPLLLLVVLSGLLAMLAYQVRSDQGQTLLGRGVRGLVSPLVWAASSAVRGVEDAWDGYVALRGARKDALRARRQRDEARALALLAEETLRENDRLRDLLGLREELGAEATAVAARVVGGGSDLLDDGLLIDRGTRHGVRPGCPVVAAGGAEGGLVGRVVFASPWQARVQLLTDRSASVAVQDQDYRVQGIVRGEGEGRCSFEWINRPEDVLPGSVLITSGLDALFPKGLAVAVLREPRGAVGYGTGIPVRPVLRLSAVEEVLVLPPVTAREPLPEDFEPVKPAPRPPGPDRPAGGPVAAAAEGSPVEPPVGGEPAPGEPSATAPTPAAPPALPEEITEEDVPPPEEPAGAEQGR